MVEVRHGVKRRLFFEVVDTCARYEAQARRSEILGGGLVACTRLRTYAKVSRRYRRKRIRVFRRTTLGHRKHGMEILPIVARFQCIAAIARQGRPHLKRPSRRGNKGHGANGLWLRVLKLDPRLVIVFAWRNYNPLNQIAIAQE